MHQRFVVAIATLLAASGAGAQSELPSAISEISIAPSVVAADVSLAAVEGSATFVVGALHASGDVVVLVLESAARGVSITIEVTRELAGELSLATGTVIVATASAAGWLLSAAGEAVAFVPNAAARAMIHHRELSSP